MKSELVLAIKQLCEERKLPPEVILEAVEAALISAYKRDYGPALNIRAKIDPKTGQARVYADKLVVEKVTNNRTQISLEEARRIDPNAQVGQTITVETTPTNFGRIAAQTAKQVIMQRIREAERNYIYNALVDKEGELIVGVIQKVDHATGNVIVNIDKVEALMPRKEQIPTERYYVNQRALFYILEVYKSGRGPQVILSRSHKNFLKRLFEREVPEIMNGIVEIKAIAREAGSRSKVAVRALQPGVDPVGACVGMRGLRIQNIVKELNGEKIDVVEWNQDPAVFVANALSPAKVIKVILRRSDDDKTAVVIVPDNQLSLAIGREGQNARLAAKLTGWRIDIKSESEAKEEGLLTGEELRETQQDILALAEAILTGKKPIPSEAKAQPTALTEALAKSIALEQMQPPEPSEAVEEPKPEPEKPEKAKAKPRSKKAEKAGELTLSLEDLKAELSRIRTSDSEEERKTHKRKKK
ncbi:MAG: transcription termination/antitermination protein NusA [Chloroflexi bacterium]|nr:MAG: transcription termination/antitermination protein NusA [Chloroflexota bacterium]